MSKFVNSLWPVSYSRQSMAQLFRPLLTTFNQMVDGYLFTLPDGAPLTADYTVTSGDSFIPVDASSASVTITLPDADETKGKRFTVKKMDSTTNAVVVTSTNTIDDGVNASITQQYVSLCFMSDGSEYWIV